MSREKAEKGNAPRDFFQGPGGWCEPGKSTGRLSPLSRRPEGSKDGRMAALKAA